jgi:superfamily II DNA/RNA helicase
VLITTPTTLLALIKEEGLSLSQLTRLTLDEADTLFDRNFMKESQSVIQLVKDISERRGISIPISFFTATLPQTLDTALDGFLLLFNHRYELDFNFIEIPQLIRLTTPSLHHTPSSIHQEFYRLNQSTTKLNLLTETLRRITDTKRILIFCNTQTGVDVVYRYLLSKSYPVIELSSQVGLKELGKNMTEFQSESEELVVAVATDIASRGIGKQDLLKILSRYHPCGSCYSI